MNSVYAAGGLVGCLSVGTFADRIGRKLSIQLITCLCIAASIITTASISMPMFLVGRALQGIRYACQLECWLYLHADLMFSSSGMINTICPLYQSEISPPNARGSMVGSHAVFLVAGYVSVSASVRAVF
jgi:MFS family permease